jgi:hypothetical protein
MAQIGCKGNDGKSCALLGSMLENDKKIDEAKAAYTSACTNGWKDACKWKDEVGKAHEPVAEASAGEGGNEPAGEPAESKEDSKVTDCKAKGDHYAMCDDDCVDLSSSHDNCGACKAECPSEDSCEESLSFGIKCKEPDGTYEDPH